MKKLLFVLALCMSFITTSFSNCVTSVEEVITERGSNCYSAILRYGEKFQEAGLTGLAMAIGAISALLWDFNIVDALTTIAPVGLVAWIKEDKFVKLDSEAITKLTEEDIPKYQDALSADQLKREEDLATKITDLMENEEKNAEEIKTLTEQLKGIDLEVVKTMLSTIKEQGIVLAKMKDQGVITEGGLKTVMKAAWDSKLADIKKAHDEKKNIEITVKATQTFGDIDAGLDFAQMKPGITDVPVRRPIIRDLFGTIPMSTEFLKYTEQNTVVRDAQNVAKCAAITSNTKETLVVNDISTKVIKDQIDFCRLFIDDYPFMESRINKLINQSISLRVDAQLLLGDGTGENTFSIDSVSSTFNAANAACDISSSIQAGTYVDLILGMETQIFELGQQNDYVPDTVLVNKCDWFIFVQSRKDLNNNYLDARVTMVNGVPFVGGMRVIWSTLVPQNELYVFDSTKGDVVDRQELVLEVAFENKDNWEKQIASLQGYVRLNFLVEDNNANAFMHAPDVAAAITAITI